MMRIAMIAVLIWAGATQASEIAVPSGQPVDLFEVIEDPDGTAGLTLRYRFVAPEIAREGGSIGIDSALDDIEALCESVVLPQLQHGETVPDQVVISLMDRPIEFGATNPQATQFFEAFRIENGQCVWEGL